MTESPFSVWNFHTERMEEGCVVSWKEEYEQGTSHVRIVVRSQEEFFKAVDRFVLRVKGTWPLI